MSRDLIHVLLVEDDSVDAESVRRILADDPNRDARFRTDRVVALQEALDRLGKGDIEVVLLDLHLPDSNGVDTVVRLRTSDPEVPIVVFTGAHDDRIALGALQAGAQDYLVKDELGSPWVLLRAIRYAIERQKIARANRRLAGLLTRTERMASLGVLSAGVAVGLNPLLGTILEETDAVDEVLAVDQIDRVQKSMAAIRKAALRAGQIAAQLRDYAAGQHATLHPVDLSEFVLEASPSLDAVAAGHRISYDLVGSGLVVVAGCLQLYQILVSLVTNAAEAIGDEPGGISISTGLLEADSEVLDESLGFPDASPGIFAFLRVADTGCGIDPNTKGRIFDPFFTTKFAGRGLGLAALLGIVRELRARVHFESVLGRGSTFTVLLPIA